MFSLKKKVLFSAIILMLGIGMISNEALAQEESQAQLSGSVVDATTQQGISGVEVTLQNAGKSATTTEDGTYIFESLEPGSYTVVVEAESYERWSKQVEVKEGGTTLDIKLQPKES